MFERPKKDDDKTDDIITVSLDTLGEEWLRRYIAEKDQAKRVEMLAERERSLDKIEHETVPAQREWLRQERVRLTAER